MKKYPIFCLIGNAFSYHRNWQRAWRNPEPKPRYDAVIEGGVGHGLVLDRRRSGAPGPRRRLPARPRFDGFYGR